MSNDTLPDVVQDFAGQHPEVWDAYQRLGQAAGEAGPLDARTVRLVKLAIAAGAGREGAVRAHVRRALDDGLSREELEHVALLCITTAGWPAAFAALCWIREEIEDSAIAGKPEMAGERRPR